MVDKPKDDNAFEDADFEDLDALEDDDLGDENWDDDLGGTGAADDSGGGDDDGEPRIRGEKTFVQKNFMLIVGAVVVVFGGLVGVAFMGGGSPAPLPDEQAAAPGDSLPDAPATTAYEDRRRHAADARADQPRAGRRRIDADADARRFAGHRARRAEC
jgi:hypothetical protein